MVDNSMGVKTWWWPNFAHHVLSLQDRSCHTGPILGLDTLHNARWKKWGLTKSLYQLGSDTKYEEWGKGRKNLWLWRSSSGSGTRTLPLTGERGAPTRGLLVCSAQSSQRRLKTSSSSSFSFSYSSTSSSSSCSSTLPSTNAHPLHGSPVSQVRTDCFQLKLSSLVNQVGINANDKKINFEEYHFQFQCWECMKDRCHKINFCRQKSHVHLKGHHDLKKQVGFDHKPKIYI